MKHRFLVLDGLRGVAAVAVVLLHFGGYGRYQITQHGYLAVDFFFMLSGFVLAYAYGDRLGSRAMSPGRFFVVRFIRLWPMALLGTALGVVAVVTLDVPTEGIAGAALMNALLLPNLLDPRARLFPFNPPHWSLWFELVANVTYGLVAPRLSRAVLIALVIVAGAAFAVATGIAGIGEHFGPPRIAFSFIAGIMLQRARLPVQFGPRTAVGLAMMLFGILAIPRAWFPGAVDAVYVMALFPAIIAIGAATELPAYARSIAGALGEMSYPLYAIHFPLIRLVTIRETSTAQGVAWTMVLVVVSLGVSRAYDMPARRYLNSLTAPRRTARVEA